MQKASWSCRWSHVGTRICHLMQGRGPALTGTLGTLTPNADKLCHTFTPSSTCTQHLLFKYMNVDVSTC